MKIFRLFSRETSNRTEKRKIGDEGEEIFVKHLVKHHHEILDRNYRKKWGEIDVITKKENIIHFFEVKTLRIDFDRLEKGDFYNPEENVHYWKQKRLSRAIQTYLAQRKIPEEQEYQVDIAAVFLDFGRRRARIRITEDIELA